MTDTRIALTLMFASDDKPSIVATRVGEVVAAEVAAPLVSMAWSAFNLAEDDTDEEPDWESVAKEREAERDGAYRERAQLLAWLATLHAPNAVLAPALDIDDEDGWHLLFLTVAGRQMSWHIAPRDMDLLTHVERVDVADPRAQWDGHTTDEKYQRIRTLPWGEMRDAVRTPGPAEAAIERVRAMADTQRARGVSGSTDHKIGLYDAAVAILAALDEPTQEQS